MKMRTEVWKSLDGVVYAGFEIIGYEVSNYGRVRSTDRISEMKNGRKRFKQGKIRLTKFNNRGYEMVSLFFNGKEKTCLIHRLVAMVFIENPDNLPEVNHKDNDKTNNNDTNLEWMTSKDNHAHATENGFRDQKAENGNNSILKNSEVLEIRELIKAGEYTYSELGHKFGVSSSSIGRIANRDSYRDI